MISEARYVDVSNQCEAHDVLCTKYRAILYLYKVVWKKATRPYTIHGKRNSEGIQQKQDPVELHKQRAYNYILPLTNWFNYILRCIVAELKSIQLSL